MVELVIDVDGNEYSSVTSKNRETCIKYASQYIEQALQDCKVEVTLTFYEWKGDK
jgi:hypothetical protein